MIYESSSQRIDDMEKMFGEKSVYRMATVMSVSGGRPIIRFNGETKNAEKKYKYLGSYSPAVGDKVILARISRSYVILGKVV